MKKLLLLLLLLTLTTFGITLYPIGDKKIPTPQAVPEKVSHSAAPESKNSCLSCHQGIEHIREPQSKMMKAILKKAEKAGAKGNDCVVCHGGNPASKTTGAPKLSIPPRAVPGSTTIPAGCATPNRLPRSGIT